MKQNAFVIWLAVVVVLGGVLGGAFAGGIAIGKSQGREQATQELQSQRSQLVAGLGQRGSQQGTPQPGSSLPGGLGGFAGRGGTVGAVEKVEGNVVTLNTPQGAIRVMVDGSTSIQKIGQGSLGDISAGESITV